MASYEEQVYEVNEPRVNSDNFEHFKELHDSIKRINNLIENPPKDLFDEIVLCVKEIDKKSLPKETMMKIAEIIRDGLYNLYIKELNIINQSINLGPVEGENND